MPVDVSVTTEQAHKDPMIKVLTGSEALRERRTKEERKTGNGRMEVVGQNIRRNKEFEYDLETRLDVSNYIHEEESLKFHKS